MMLVANRTVSFHSMIG